VKKVVDIGSGKKPEPDCKFCGKAPACPDWTCERLASVWFGSDGSWEVRFIQEVYELEFLPEGDDEPIE
jgi:hypothetical protein